MSDDFTPAGDYYDPSVDSSVDVGATGPTRGGGGFFDDLLGLARQFVPGVNTAINVANRLGGVLGGLFSGGGSGGTYSAFDQQISSRSALGQDPSDFPSLFTGTAPWLVPGWAHYQPTGTYSAFDTYNPVDTGPLEVPPIYRTNFIAADPQITGEEAGLSTVGPISGMDIAIPMGEGSIPKTLLQWLKRIAVAYGPSVASAVWLEYQKRRRSGQSGTLAKAALDSAYPVRGRISRGRRRRMNPANIRALRRAIRRVRGFKRATRKVRGLGLWGHRGGKTKVVYRRARRGDLYAVEDAADEYDEAEDFDMPEGFFREDEMSEEALDY